MPEIPKIVVTSTSAGIDVEPPELAPMITLTVCGKNRYIVWPNIKDIDSGVEPEVVLRKGTQK